MIDEITKLDQNVVALIGHGLTLIGIIVGILIVIWQLGRQHKSSLLLQRENAREELKLRLHEILVQKVRKLSHANTAAAMYAFSIPFNLKIYQDQLSQGLRPSPVKERTPELSRLHWEAHAAYIELLQEFEAWSIAFPGLEVFQVALNTAAHDANKAFTPLFTGLLKVLPIDPPEDAPPSVPRPFLRSTISEEDLAHINTLLEPYKKAMDDIGCYVHDLTIESQNNLLSELFEGRVPARKPLDSSLKAISADPAKKEELLNYFENETAWGKNKKEIEAAVRAEHEKP